MLSLATFSPSPRSLPISSTTGETMWHGTHHSAQKSTSTGVSDPRTVVWKSASPTDPMFAIACAPSYLGVTRPPTSRQVPPGSQNVASPGDISRRGGRYPARWSSARYRSASIAALHPWPAAVTPGLAPLAGGLPRLPLGVVGDVAGDEHPRHVGRRGRLVHDQIAVFVDG